MNTHFAELIQGEFQYEVPHLMLSPERIDLHLKANTKYRERIQIGAEDGRSLSGFVTSDHQRILLALHQFSGKEKQIEYGIDLTGMQPGDELDGSITVTTDLEERTIPIHVLVEEETLKTSSGKVTTLNAFAKLAASNFREAFSIFITPQFEQLLTGEARQYASLYRGLSRNPVTHQHLEEFLIASGRKEEIHVTADKTSRVLENPAGSNRDTIYLFKNTWGYVHLEIETRGDFLEAGKKVVTSEDFIGSAYGLEYYIHAQHLSPGHHYGKILIHNVHETMEIQIEVIIPSDEDQEKTLRIHQLWLELQKNYLNLLTHQTKYPTWIRTSWEQVEALKREGVESAWLYLWQTMLHDYAEESKLAREVLAEMGDKKIPLDTPEEKALYLFYAGRYSQTSLSTENLVDRLNLLANMDPTSWMIQHLLFQTDEMHQNPARMLHTCEQLYELGNNSPFLYMEAAKILLNQAGQLRRLTPFMIRTLLFVQKKKMLVKPLLSRAAYLSQSQKTYQEQLCRFLMRGYEQFPEDDILEAVCRQIMLDKPGNPDNFIWYSRAVDRKIRITRLYEHYVETLSPSYEEILPQPIRMYFGYSNSLSSRKKAQIYANIVKHEKDDPDTWNVYKTQIENFVQDQIHTGRIDGDYAVLYRRFLRKPESAEEAQYLARVLYTFRLTCKDHRIRRVIIQNAVMEKEKTYPLENGIAYIQMYSKDSMIFLEDEKRRRFATTVPYELESLLEDRELALACGPFQPKSSGLTLYLCKEKAWQMEITKNNLGMYEKASENPSFTLKYQDTIRGKLLEWYLGHASDSSCEEAVRRMDEQVYARLHKADTIRVLVEYGQFERAFSLVDDYGCEEIQPGILMRLVTNMLRLKNYEASEELLCLAVECWKRRIYDEAILSYLAEHYDGSCQLLSSLWKDLSGFHLNHDILEERILKQVISSRSWPSVYPEILERYIRMSGQEEIIKAGIIYGCYGYFLDGHKLTEKLYEYLEEMIRLGWNVPEICRLALLKYYSSLEALSENRKTTARKLLDTFIYKGYRFADWQKLPESVIGPYQLKNPIFIEARYPAEASPILHYRFGEGEWKEEVLQTVYPGIFNREFLLFYGEEVEYYLSVKLGDEETATEKQKIMVDQISTSEKTRYSLLNEAIAAGKLGNRNVLERVAREYTRRDALVRTAFELME